jgi:hypothetical protein
MISNVGTQTLPDAAAAQSIVVVQNWLHELEGLTAAQ